MWRSSRPDIQSSTVEIAAVKLHAVTICLLVNIFPMFPMSVKLHIIIPLVTSLLASFYCIQDDAVTVAEGWLIHMCSFVVMHFTSNCM